MKHPFQMPSVLTLESLKSTAIIVTVSEIFATIIGIETVKDKRSPTIKLRTRSFRHLILFKKMNM